QFSSFLFVTFLADQYIIYFALVLDMSQKSILTFLTNDQTLLAHSLQIVNPPKKKWLMYRICACHCERSEAIPVQQGWRPLRLRLAVTYPHPFFT
ncbi:MAG: hypothetical protein JW953_14990, partial [Anaerolineae bacterium]|nr:hypothetical protein [Anaerolineae bacterium]